MKQKSKLMNLWLAPEYQALIRIEQERTGFSASEVIRRALDERGYAHFIKGENLNEQQAYERLKKMRVEEKEERIKRLSQIENGGK